MIAVAILLLAEEGKLSLEDNLATFIEYPNAENVTLRMLLQMRSGYLDFIGTEWFAEAERTCPNEILFSANEILLRTKSEELVSSDYLYSNTNYLLLGKVLEHVTESTADQVLDRMIFQKLGMKKTALKADPHFDYFHRKGFTKNKETTLWSISWAWTAGGVISTFNDVHIFMNALIKNELLSFDSLKLMIEKPFEEIKYTFEEGNERNGYYGLGIVIHGDWIFHNGSIPGYDSFIGFNQKIQATVSIFFNQSREDRNMTADFYEMITNEINS